MARTSRNENNGLMSEKQFKKLAGIHEPHCISIFLPTFRAGEDVDNKMGQLRLKNLLKELKSSLRKFGLKEQTIKSKIEKFQPLLDDIHFWRNQSDGLALFLHGDDLQYYTLPVHFKEFVYVADHFYLIPVIPFFNDDGKFFLLVLSTQEVDFYECSRHFISDVPIEDLTPERLEDAVGYDYRDKSLQHRSGQDTEPGAMYHGQGAGKDDKEPEIEKFFRAVDSGLMKLLHDKKAPLVLACVDHYYPIYKKATDYKYLFDKHISGNPEHENPVLLHEKAWLLVEDHFKQQRNLKIAKIKEIAANDKTTYELEDIVKASVDGRMDTLFILEGTDKYGIYDEKDREVILDDKSGIYQASLYNMAAIHAIGNGGKVYLSKKNEMPFKDTEINALLRY